MVLDYKKYEAKPDQFLRDTRDTFSKAAEDLRQPRIVVTVFISMAAFIAMHPWAAHIADVIFMFCTFYYFWLFKAGDGLPFKMPQTADQIDPNNKAPGSKVPQKADGILYLGNEERSKEELWISNSDARTHILYLGTTGAGKTEGLKSLVSNAMGWGSGFIYIDGKADTDLWSSLSSLTRRFGRDDDLLVLNYMTGNSDEAAPSNTVNPFSFGSASYLTNLMVSLMPDAGGDNAMWKDRAVSLMAALMPVLTWRRNHQGHRLSITTLRDSLIFKRIIQLARDPMIPEKLRRGIKGYLDTLPGYNDDAFNDDGTERPGPGGQPQDMSVVYQQHGYLAMQFTRQLQSLADDYGYIFEKDSADIEMIDVVLNRRILVVLIPALEKSSDETANLGKILGSMLKGMMGGTLGAQVEGDVGQAIENKPTRAPTPFMAIFDEVGYYTAQGMAVMAAQARSLGFCLVFAAQDLPAMEKRVKEEARSITANCNLKIFGKLEDPTDTKDFFEKTVGETFVTEASSQKEVSDIFGDVYADNDDTVSVKAQAKASYGELKSFTEGEAVVVFGDTVIKANFFFADPKGIKALRLNKFIAMPDMDVDNKRGSRDVDAVIERFREKGWSAEKHAPKVSTNDTLRGLVKGFAAALKNKSSSLDAGIMSLLTVAVEDGLIDPMAIGEAPKAIESDVEDKPAKIAETKAIEDQSPAEEPVAPEAPIADEDPKTEEPITQPEAQNIPNVDTASVGDDDDDDDGEPLSWTDILDSDEEQDVTEEKPEAPSEEIQPSDLNVNMDAGYAIDPSTDYSDVSEAETAPLIDDENDDDQASEPLSWAEIAGEEEKNVQLSLIDGGAAENKEIQDVPGDSDEETPEADPEPAATSSGFPGQEDEPLSWMDLVSDKDKENADSDPEKED